MRQDLDVGLFMKRWAVGMLQEATRATCDQLELSNSLFLVDESRLGGPTSHAPAVFMSRDFASRVRELDIINKETEDGRWALKGIFGEFSLISPIGSIKTLRVGSAHLACDQAARFCKSQALMEDFMHRARSAEIDLIGVDLNRAAYTHAKHATERSSFINAAKVCYAESYAQSGSDDVESWRGCGLVFSDKPLGLLGQRVPDDCTGIVIPPWSQLFKLRLARHGIITLRNEEIGLRSSDTSAHKPAFCYWRLPSNKRNRSVTMSEKRLARRERKRMKRRRKSTGG